MRTLVFCTSFADRALTWRQRYGRWLDALRRSQIQFDQILIADDASPVPPPWSDLLILEEPPNGGEADPRCAASLGAEFVMYRFRERRGRQPWGLPGWHRSFAFAAKYGFLNGFDKVIHIESDAFIISREMQALVNQITEGWVTPWCPRHGFPEMAIEVVSGSQVRRFAEWADRPYSEMSGRCHEWSLPYTHIVRNLIGDRYENSVPRIADFAMQVLSHLGENHYWWLNDDGPTNAMGSAAAVVAISELPVEGQIRHEDVVLRVTFGSAGNCCDFVGGGWSGAEPNYRWSVGTESDLQFGPMDREQTYLVQMRVGPYTSHLSVPYQRIIVIWNDRIIGETKIAKSCSVTFRLPPESVSTVANVLKILTPFPAEENFARQGELDSRPLALAFHEILIARNSPSVEPGHPSYALSYQALANLLPAKILAHIRYRGDAWFAMGEIVGEPQNGKWIEGFGISSGFGIPSAEIEYRAVLSTGRLSEVHKADEFAGGRGASAPLRGFSVRLRGTAAERFICSYEGWFSDGEQIGPLGDGEVCRSSEDAVLEAFRIEIRRKRDRSPC